MIGGGVARAAVADDASVQASVRITVIGTRTRLLGSEGEARIWVTVHRLAAVR